MIEVFDVLLMAFMVLLAWSVIRIRDLFAATMLMGIFSLMSAGWLTVQDAVDVAFTEAAVGAGVSTVLMLCTLALVPTEEKPPLARPLLPLVVVLLTGGALIYATLDMPEYGDPNSYVNVHPMAEEFIERSPEKLGVPNIVTSVLASYRGYDTLGETTVIFTAGIGVLLLLGGVGPQGGRRMDIDDGPGGEE